MKLLVIAAFCAVAMALPEGRRLRPEEHWRASPARDLSKYQSKMPKVDSVTDKSWEENMIKKISKVAAQMRSSGSISNKKDLNRPKVECGIEGPAASDRIVGGEEAKEHAWPWQVALFIDDAWFCGGSIISENYILTAAHCVEGSSYYNVMAGAHNVRDSNEPNRVEVTSYKGWTHPEWSAADLANDLALIELPEPVPFNEYISPSCLPAKGDAVDTGDMVGVTGWGKPSDSAGGISPVLRQVLDLPVITNAKCNEAYGMVGEGVVCIDTTGGRGSCNGDSGGPLIRKAADTKEAGQKWDQVGIVSFGSSGGCEIGLPAGFTRTEYYIDWITSETGL